MIYFVTNRPIKIYIQCTCPFCYWFLSHCKQFNSTISVVGLLACLGGVQWMHRTPPGYAYDQDTVFYLFISMVYCGTILHW